VSAAAPARSDPVVQAAATAWPARFTAAGVDPGDFERTVEGVETWAEWLPAWVALGERHEALAREADALDRGLTAAQARSRASLAYHFASFVWWLDHDLREDAMRRSAAMLRTALPVLDPEAEYLQVPLGSGAMVGLLRKPQTPGRPALVVLIPGLDSTKEELWDFSTTFVERGLACLVFEGPGQGEGGTVLPMIGNYEVAITALLDALAGRDDLDLERVGLVGVSMGGYYAPRAAAYEKRVKAVVGVSGPFDLSSLYESMNPLMATTITERTHSSTRDEMREKLADFDLAEAAPLVEQPMLVLTGKDDVLIPWKETQRIASAAPNATFIAWDGATHVCYNMRYLYRPLAADWIREQLEPEGIGA
jgi:2,6-dihydroxypseudooxynicotine hydrolase